MKHEKKALLKIAYQRVLAVTLLDLKAPLKWVDEYVSETVTGFGTAADEKFSSIEGYRAIIVNSRKQAKGLAFNSKSTTKYKPRFTGDNTACFIDELVVTIGKSSRQMVMHLSVGLVFHFLEDKWKLIALHAAKIDTDSSAADTFHLGEAEKKMQALQLEVAKRTEELSQKNKDLKIEAALERVRAVAMAMQQPEDMLNICKNISHQLQSLGLKEIRNIQTAIFYPQRGSYMNYEYYAKHDKTFITDVAYKDHKIQIAFARKMMKGANEQVVEQLKGAQLKEWYNYQKTTNQFADKYILTAHSLNYYWYSIGPVALGISTYVPLNKEDLNLFQRFLKVFELAYRRYLDIEKAEAQAREAIIEKAIEKVRSRSLAMHRSEEIMDVASLVAEKLKELHVQMDACTILIFHENNTEYWIAGSEAGYTHKFLTKPERMIEGSAVASDFAKHQPVGQNYTRCYNKKEKNQHWKYLFRYSDFKKIPVSRKQFILNQPAYNLSVAFSGDISLTILRYQPIEYTEAENQLINRFAKVFAQAYTRFSDLQKAEAQAREAEIQLALERVRAKTLAMQKAEGLLEVICEVSQQMENLGLQFTHTNFRINEGEKDWDLWSHFKWLGSPARWQVPYRDMAFFNQSNNNIDGAINTRLFTIEETQEVEAYLFQLGILSNPVNKEEAALMDRYFKQARGFAWSNFRIKNISLTVANNLAIPYTDEQNAIIQRFAIAFVQAYTRFLDLQKAEAQAREAQIEASLERVRSKAMAMQNSSDLPATAIIAFSELKKLGFVPIRGGISIQNKENRKKLLYSATTTEQGDNLSIVGWAILDHHPVLKEAYDSWMRGEDYFPELHGDLLKSYYEQVSNSFAVPVEQTQVDQYGYFMYFTHGLFYGWCNQPVTEIEKKLLKRFASVIDLTFKRYFDLQKAEEQAREAQIEASLEKVRSVAMSMHHSNELLNICESIYAELLKLGMVELRNTMINIHDDEEETFLNYDFSAYGGRAVTKYGYHVHPIINRLVMQCRGVHDAFLDIPFEGEAFAEWRSFRKFSGEKDDARLDSITHLHYYFYSLGIGSIGISTFESIDERKLALLKRFRNVFQLAYQRFTDLAAAEAQAREAQIETALERVRARTMAMQKSSELSAVAHVLFEEFKQLHPGLGDKLSRAFVITVDEEHQAFQFFITTAEGEYLPEIYPLSFSEKTNGQPLQDCWQSGAPMLILVLEGAVYQQWLQYLDSIQLYIPPEIKALKKRVNHFMRFSKGFLGVTANEVVDDDAITLLQRFAKVFDQTYTRFVDLQIAETSAREAIKQASLDRIRADIASMRSVVDLDRITPIIWNELRVLGISFVRCGIFIMDESTEQIHTFLSSPDGAHIAAYYMRFRETSHIYDMVQQWRKHEPYIQQWTLKEFELLADSLHQQGAITDKVQYLQHISPQGIYLHFIPFIQGMLYVGNDAVLTEEDLSTLAAMADAFSTAYARYEDFNSLEMAKQQVENALSDLKQAQKQLVQSEKMASLGELTAGIAHEIQNPLNFVNNFSEVTQELLEELRQELKHGNTDGVQDLMDDIIQNLEKINHHGKRADGIVKGMLQHSRTSSGQKELIDINILCDEYLRLSYHGLRAKDKSFNAKFETSFDETITKVNIMPQEMGRVILNLINNAFYAVSKRQQQAEPGYVPTVQLKTALEDNKILISVQDNGSGIPEQIKDKIFQPFFTTKPTGEGTGLGLSLSYDIVKAHGGELRVESEEGEGTLFKIELPI